MVFPPLNNIGLDTKDEEVILQLLQKSSNDPPTLEDIWMLMDLVWDQLECDNQKLDFGKIKHYYNHPVWTLNGLFIEQDAISMKHRHAISDWIVRQNGIKTVIDYGGGFGTLARLIAKKNPQVKVDIYEPHPSNLAKKKISLFPNIEFVSSLPRRNYDCLVSIDVLEHVPDPLDLLATMIDCVKPNGFLLLATNFFPVIKCHLPLTFHFRYSFNIFTRLMNLRMLAHCEGSHATIYQKSDREHIDWKKIRFLEKISSKSFPALTFMHRYYKKIKSFKR